MPDLVLGLAIGLFVGAWFGLFAAALFAKGES